MNTAVSTAPSHRCIVYFVKENSHSNTIETTMTEKSVMVIPSSRIGHTAPVAPRINRTLKTFEPRTLPMAMPLLPFLAATTLVASSGMEVPIATTVKPITASLTPK